MLVGGAGVCTGARDGQEGSANANQVSVHIVAVALARDVPRDDG